ncbi:hypothetical protein HGA91_05330 [candidate division WWE3 bacterium]|nr:hypothetical protein [candidate division WWE3 bacterium]
MDYRIQSIVENLLKALQINMGDYDRLSIPGGAANLGQLFEDLRLSRKLHDTHQVILTTHEDCGYGATRESLTEAIDTARILYPDSKIRAFYLYLDGTWEEIAC